MCGKYLITVEQERCRYFNGKKEMETFQDFKRSTVGQIKKVIQIYFRSASETHSPPFSRHFPQFCALLALPFLFIFNRSHFVAVYPLSSCHFPALFKLFSCHLLALSLSFCYPKLFSILFLPFHRPFPPLSLLFPHPLIPYPAVASPFLALSLLFPYPFFLFLSFSRHSPTLSFPSSSF